MTVAAWRPEGNPGGGDQKPNDAFKKDGGCRLPKNAKIWRNFEYLSWRIRKVITTRIRGKLNEIKNRVCEKGRKG